MPAISVATVKSGYRSIAIDTSIDADVLFFHHLQQLTLQQKALRVQQLDRIIRAI
jgi:hypothetical protein